MASKIMNKINPSIKFAAAITAVSVLLTATMMSQSWSSGEGFLYWLNSFNLFGSATVLLLATVLLSLGSISTQVGTSIIILSALSILSNSVSSISLLQIFMDKRLNSQISQFILFGFSAFAYAGFSQYLLYSLCQVEGRIKRHFSIAFSMPIVFILASAIVASSFSDLGSFAVWVTYYLYSTILLFPLYFGISLLMNKERSLNRNNFAEALQLRLNFIKSSQTGFLPIISFYVVSTLEAVAFVAGKEISHFIWMALGTIIYFYVKNHFQSHRELTLDSIVSNTTASKYLKRHFQKNQQWAATSGARTANFIINHSLEKKERTNKIPATIQQIRNQLIKDSVQKLLQNRQLNSSNWGSRIYGSIDPETVTRPCIELITLFTCLYMDGIPLLERRLKTLALIIPILDEGSRKVINNEMLNKLFSKNTWLFYLDFSWVDQHIIHANQNASYHFDSKVEDPEEKHLIASELKKRNLLGNYIWLSDAARHQLEVESPFLSSIVVPVELSLPTKGECIVFLLKFEDLIPRLQRFHLLDIRRDELKDLPQNQDSKRLCNLIELQISQDFDLEKSLEILNSIRSFPWVGFKAKDAALELILKLYEKTISFIELRTFEEEIRKIEHDKCRTEFISAIAEIGYPSQALHSAQMNKMALRDKRVAFDIALQPKHQRFHDSWLFISSGDNRLSESESEQYLDFIESVLKRDWRKQKKFVKNCSVTCLNLFSKAFIRMNRGRIQVLISNIYMWNMSELIMDDLFWLMDTHINITQKLGEKIEISEPAREALNRLDEIQTESGSREEVTKLAFSSRLRRINGDDSEGARPTPISFISDAS